MNSSSVDTRGRQDIVTPAALIVSAMQGGPAAVTEERLQGLILSVASTLRSLSSVAPVDMEDNGPHVPAVSIRKSLGEDYIICLEDGKRLKMLKRYLNSRYGMSPDQYRRKWGLSPDYPMTAPSHSKRRSNLAKQNGLGRKAGATL